MNHGFSVPKQNIENAVIHLCSEIQSENNNQKRWEAFSEDELWFELVSCILGSRVKYETASACSYHLKEENLINISPILSDPKTMELKINAELSKPIYPPFSNRSGIRYPFPKSKANFIIKTCLEIYSNSSTTIKQILRKTVDPFQVRIFLVKMCYGIGLKQASLFLRNIHFCDNLAILDTHVLRFIEIILSNSINKINTTMYLKCEKILKDYADSIEVPLATLDYAIWIVMRLLRKEFAYASSYSRLGWS